MPTSSITALRAELAARGLDAFALPRFDAHQGEYIAPHDERLRHVTGFSGTAGMALVLEEEVALFVDGRYRVQALRECADPVFSHHDLTTHPPDVWLARNARPGWRVGLDPWHWPPSWFDRLKDACHATQASLVLVEDNPVDAIWLDQAPPPQGMITSLPDQIAGRSHASKARDLVAYLQRENAELLVETQPDNIAWFLNVRGADSAFIPAPQSFLLANAAGQVLWFVDSAKLTPGATPKGVTIMEPDSFLQTLAGYAEKPGTILYDPDFSPEIVRQCIASGPARALPVSGWITHAKAVKNEVELAGLRACHVEDGIAWTEFAAWLAEQVPVRAASGEPVTEREAEQRMIAFRKKRPGYLSESFNPISAAGSNAALCHYAALPEADAPILPAHPYLLDSGAQFETGTTDATRCYSFGYRPEGYDLAYTAVFKAFHALATLHFPPGTQGHHIDAICRRPLWDLGLDYDHGTGHGVGHRLSVHEHPQRIGKPHNPVDLCHGMVVSIEPGHYIADRFGVRIENVFEIVGCDDGFMEFRNLTLTPIQTDMIIRDQLTDAEHNWLESYHQEVANMLTPHLSARAQSWLARSIAA